MTALLSSGSLCQAFEMAPKCTWTPETMAQELGLHSQLHQRFQALRPGSAAAESSDSKRPEELAMGISVLTRP